MYIFCTTSTRRSHSLRGAFPLHFTYSSKPGWEIRMLHMLCQFGAQGFSSSEAKGFFFVSKNAEMHPVTLVKVSRSLGRKDLSTYSKYSESGGRMRGTMLSSLVPCSVGSVVVYNLPKGIFFSGCRSRIPFIRRDQLFSFPPPFAAVYFHVCPWMV